MAVSAYRTAIWKPVVKGFSLPPAMTWPEKRPLEYLDYSLDLSRWLADSGDSIASVQASCATAGLIITPHDGAWFDGQSCTLMLAGGLVGTTYVVDHMVTSSAGRIGEFSVVLPVVAAPLSTTITPGDVPQPVFSALQAAWWNGLPTTLPDVAGVPWNNGGILSWT